MAAYPKIVHTEEGMRDGLQIENPDIPVADKIRLLDALSETGLKEIAVGSFVSPKWTPQMACIDELVGGFHPKPGVRYTYTALNDRGRERAREYIPPLSERITEYSLRMDMPRIDTLEQAKHFVLGAKAYEGAPSPWAAPITSYQRPESLAQKDAPARTAHAADPVLSAKVLTMPR